MNGLFETITLALAGIILIDSSYSIEALNENDINSRESIKRIKHTVESENNNSSSNDTLNDHVTGITKNTNESLSSDNAMHMCNQTFQTPKVYLIELNLTGTLPNEIDSSSMCFIHCYLMKVGVIKNDGLDKERIDSLQLTRNADILDDCAKESRDQKEHCSMAYIFLRCVTVFNLIFDNIN